MRRVVNSFSFLCNLHMHYFEVAEIKSLIGNLRIRGVEYIDIPKDKIFDNYFVFTSADCKDFLEITNTIYEKGLRKKINRYINTQGSTLFVCPGEGWSNKDIFLCIHRIIEMLGLSGICKYADLTVNNHQCYIKYCEENKLDQKLQCFVLPNIFSDANFSSSGTKQYKNFDIKENNNNLNLKKLYCCFNLRSRPHRAGLIALLNYYDLIKNNYVSSPYWFDLEKKGRYDKDTDLTNFIKFSKIQFENFSNKDLIIDKLQLLRDRWPLRVDDRSRYKSTDHACQSENLYRIRLDSLIEIIPETFFEGQIFLTEKTFGAIFAGRPFLLLASVNSLKHLKSLGYKSFHPYIDESYDTIENGTDRLLAIVTEIKKLENLRNKSPNEFYEMYKKLLDIADFNQQHFLKIKKNL